MRGVMKKLVPAAILAAFVAALMAPAFAQNAMEKEMERRKKANEEADRGYRVIIKNTTPEKETKIDPWANTRAPSAEAKK